jgi:hypothetical protein
VLHSPRNSSVPYRVQWEFSQILWLLANPLLVHGIGESSYERKFQSLIESRQLPIKSDGFAANPYNEAGHWGHCGIGSDQTNMLKLDCIEIKLTLR